MKTLLLATPDVQLSDLSQRFFPHAGYGLLTAAGGIECLSKLWRDGPDVLILDEELPWGGADGVLEVLSQCEESWIAGIPVVFLARHEIHVDELAGSVRACVQRMSGAKMMPAILLAVQNVLYGRSDPMPHVTEILHPLTN